MALRRGQQPRPTQPKARQRRAEARSLTVVEAARRVHEAKVRGGRLANPKHSRNWLQVLERHAFPAIGDMPVAQVTKRDVAELLEPIWDRLPDTARRVRQRLRSTFTWALGFDLIAGPNPAGEAIEGLIAEWGRRPRVVHYSALDYRDVAAALVTIKALPRDAGDVAGLPVPDSHGGSVRGSAGSDLERDRHEGEGLDSAGRADEGRQAPPRAAVHAGPVGAVGGQAGHTAAPEASAGLQRWRLRPGFSGPHRRQRVGVPKSQRAAPQRQRAQSPRQEGRPRLRPPRLPQQLPSIGPPNSPTRAARLSK